MTEVCYSFSESFWPQPMKPPPYLGWMQVRGSQFYRCILMRLHRSFQVCIELDEASCPSGWSYSCIAVFLFYPFAAGLGLVVSPGIS